MRNSEEIQQILLSVRQAIDAKRFIPVKRKKNLDTLARMGLSWKDAQSEIYDLKEDDYVKGPETDRDRPTEEPLWVFKKTIDSQLIYIKFKILYQTDGSVKVVSFHIDE